MVLRRGDKLIVNLSQSAISRLFVHSVKFSHNLMLKDMVNLDYDWQIGIHNNRLPLSDF